MASGCNNNNALKNTCPSVISAKCVKYQGPEFLQFGVCQGDDVSEDLEIILNKLADYAKGDGIEISSIVANCDYVTGILANKDKNLSTFLQVLFDSQCTLRQFIQQLQDAQEPPFSFDLKCLTTPTNPSKDQVLQATIDQSCKNTTDIQTIFAQLANDDTEESIINAVTELIGNKILASINSCQNNITKTGSGSTAQLTLTAQCPIGTLLFGVYNVSSFDNTGLGLASSGMCGWASANGNNGTVDMRGYTAAGATNIPGPTLLPAVQAGLDPDIPTNIGARKGAYKVTLNASQLANHNHVVTQNPHSHTAYGIVSQNFPDFGDGGAGKDLFAGTVTTSGALADITIGGVTGGSGQPHENRPPTFYGMWIQRIS